MQANTGSGLYIRKGHTGAFATTATITASNNKNWMPVTSVATTDSTTSLAGADAFKGTFGVLKGIKSGDATKLEYTAVTVNETKDGDAYTATVNGSETNGIYYHFELDYMITAGKSLKVTATDVSAKKDGTAVAESSPSITQATRVGIIPAASVTTDGTTKQMTGADFTDQTGKEYLVAEKAGTDYNLEELKALGYTGNSEYKDNLTRLDETGVTFNPTTTTTSDGAFAYGSLSIYVWFDGTDYSCTNAIFSQTLDLTLNFAVTK